jgi:hypothetical protein
MNERPDAMPLSPHLVASHESSEDEYNMVWWELCRDARAPLLHRWILKRNDIDQRPVH